MASYLERLNASPGAAPSQQGLPESFMDALWDRTSQSVIPAAESIGTTLSSLVSGIGVPAAGMLSYGKNLLTGLLAGYPLSRASSAAGARAEETEADMAKLLQYQPTTPLAQQQMGNIEKAFHTVTAPVRQLANVEGELYKPLGLKNLTEVAPEVGKYTGVMTDLMLFKAAHSAGKVAATKYRNAAEAWRKAKEGEVTKSEAELLKESLDELKEADAAAFDAAKTKETIHQFDQLAALKQAGEKTGESYVEYLKKDLENFTKQFDVEQGVLGERGPREQAIPKDYTKIPPSVKGPQKIVPPPEKPSPVQPVDYLKIQPSVKGPRKVEAKVDKPTKLSEDWEVLRNKQDSFQGSIVDWLVDGGEMPSPTNLYRGVSLGADFTPKIGEYVHATPWAFDAARGGKGAFGDLKGHDVYAVPLGKDTRFYRGGSLAGDPLEITRIDTSRGKTWEQVMGEAKELYGQEATRQVAEARKRGLIESPKDLRRELRHAAKNVLDDIRKATFETDALGKPGIWSKTGASPEMTRAKPPLRSYDDLRDVVDAKRKSGYTDDQIPELKILEREEAPASAKVVAEKKIAAEKPLEAPPVEAPKEAPPAAPAADVKISPQQPVEQMVGTRGEVPPPVVDPAVQKAQAQVDKSKYLKGRVKVDGLGEEGTTTPPGFMSVTIIDPNSPAHGATFTTKPGSRNILNGIKRKEKEFAPPEKTTGADKIEEGQKMSPEQVTETLEKMEKAPPRRTPEEAFEELKSLDPEIKAFAKGDLVDVQALKDKIRKLSDEFDPNNPSHDAITGPADRLLSLIAKEEMRRGEVPSLELIDDLVANPKKHGGLVEAKAKLEDAGQKLGLDLGEIESLTVEQARRFEKSTETLRSEVRLGKGNTWKEAAEELRRRGVMRREGEVKRAVEEVKAELSEAIKQADETIAKTEKLIETFPKEKLFRETLAEKTQPVVEGAPTPKVKPKEKPKESKPEVEVLEPEIVEEFKYKKEPDKYGYQQWTRKEFRDELGPVFEGIGYPEFSRRLKIQVKETFLDPGQPMEIGPTWHDGTVRLTAMRDQSGRLEIGRSGSYDSIMMEGHVAGAKKSQIPPGTTLYVVDAFPHKSLTVRIFRAKPEISTRKMAQIEGPKRAKSKSELDQLIEEQRMDMLEASERANMDGESTFESFKEDLHSLGRMKNPLGNEKGGFTIELTPEQVAAINRIRRLAGKFKKDMKQLLEEAGISPETIRFVMKISEDQARRDGAEPKLTGPYKDIDPSNVLQQAKPRFVKGVEVNSAPVLKDWAAALRQAKDLKIGEFKRWQNPLRIFEEMPKALKEIYYEFRSADKRASLRAKEAHKEYDNFVKGIGGISGKSEKRIMAYALSLQKDIANMQQLLEMNGFKSVPKLTPKEMKVYDFVQGKLAEHLKVNNEIRTSIGKGPLNAIENYIPMARAFSFLERLGVKPNPILDNPGVFAAKIKAQLEVSNPFFKPRFGKHAPLDMNISSIYKKYVSNSIKSQEVSPTMAKVNALLDGFKDGEGNFKADFHAPKLAQYLADFSNYQGGYGSSAFGPRMQWAFKTASRNSAIATLSGLVTSMFVQPAALINTWAATGLPNLLGGAAKALNPAAVSRAYKSSEHLYSRSLDLAIAERGIKNLKTQIEDVGLWGLKALDLASATVTWLAAEMHGKRMGLSGKELVRYADDVVVKTQSSTQRVDTPPFLRTPEGRFMSVLQTFMINDWNFFTKDVLGLGKKQSVGETLHKAGRMMMAMLVVNSIYKQLGLRAPAPDLAGALYDGLKDDKTAYEITGDVVGEAIEKLPYFGNIKFGKSPMSKPLTTINEMFTGKFGVTPKQEVEKFIDSGFSSEKFPLNTAEIVGTLGGIPGTAQALKYARGKRAGKDDLDALLGRQLEEPSGGGGQRGGPRVTRGRSYLERLSR